MDRTLLGQTKFEVRGGVFTVSSGADDVPPLHVGSEPQIIGRKAGCHLVLADKKVSATHCEVTAVERGVRVRDLGSTNGTFLGVHRIVEVVLQKEATLRCGDTEIEFEPGRPQRVAISKSEKFGPLVGSTAEMRALFEKLRIIAPTTVSVLVEGETGTGKELVARAIHDESDRASKPFVIIDCGSIPAGLAESTLFGHTKGAFTGAVSRRLSPFVEASGGTVFLDELGELPLEVQPKLLRVLAEQRVKSVGAGDYSPVNVRVVAATRRDLLEEINAGAFRDDLYFRVAQARIIVPPLRDRTDDLGPLVRHMMDLAGKATAFKRVTAESIDRLQRHDWPGNVRELRNLVSVALAFDKGGPIDLAAHIGEQVAARSRSSSSSRGASPGRTYAASRREHDHAYFKALWDATGGNLADIARRAELNRETVRTYLRTLRIGTYGKPGK